MLWLGCRHHTSDLLAKGSWHKVFDKDLSPDDKLMSAFKNMWDELDTSSEAELFTITEDLPGKAEAIQFYLDLFSNKDRTGALPRDNYRYRSFKYCTRNEELNIFRVFFLPLSTPLFKV